MSLNTGHKLHRYRWTPLPITTNVLERVEAIALKQKQPLIGSNFKYNWRYNINDTLDENIEVEEEMNENIDFGQENDGIIDDGEYSEDRAGYGADTTHKDNIEANRTESTRDESIDDQTSSSNRNGQTDQSDSNYAQGRNEVNADPINDSAEGAEGTSNDVSIDSNLMDTGESRASEDKEPGQSVEFAEPNENEGAEESQLSDSDLSLVSDEGASNDDDNSLVSIDDDIEKGTESEDDPEVSEVDEGTTIRRTRSGRSTKFIDYNHMNKKGMQFHQKDFEASDNTRKTQTRMRIRDMFRHVTGIIMMNEGTKSEFDQLGIKAGINRHWEAAVAAIVKECEQLKQTGTVKVVDASVLSESQKEGALNLLTLVKKKRCGKIKGRVCADGRKQRRCIDKREVSSPTVQLDSIIATLLIDGYDGRSVAIADVAGAYLQTPMTDFTIVKVTGAATNIMCQVNPTFTDKITQEGKDRVIYICDCIKPYTAVCSLHYCGITPSQGGSNTWVLL